MELWIAWSGLIVAIASVAWQVKSAADRRSWESDQQKKQNQWQIEQNNKQTERERIWREEDIARQKAASEPSLLVSLDNQNHMVSYNVDNNGPTVELRHDQVALLTITARNTGNVDVVVQTPFLLMPDGSSFEFNSQPSYDIPTAPDSFPHILKPGFTATGSVIANDLSKELRSRGFLNTPEPVQIIGVFEDQHGTQHKSIPFPLRIDIHWGYPE